MTNYSMIQKVRLLQIFLMAMAFCAGPDATADDVIILRKGEFLTADIKEVTDSSVYALPLPVTKTGRADMKTMNRNPKPIAAENLYMLSKGKGSTVFFHSDGSRDTVANKIWQEGTDRIFLIEGREIIGWDTKVTDSSVSYFRSDPDMNRYLKRYTTPLSDVFMIVFDDGKAKFYNELPVENGGLTDIDYEALEAERERKVQEKIFTLPKSMTIGEIAKLKGLNVKDLLKWNDGTGRFTAATRLKAGCTLWISPPPDTRLQIADD